MTGIILSYEQIKLEGLATPAVFQNPYYLISLSLNVLLTLMIVGRLALHSRNIRNAIGASSGAGGLYTAIITMLVESSAIYAIGCLLFVVPNITGSVSQAIFASTIGEIQVRTVFTFPRCTAIFGDV